MPRHASDDLDMRVEITYGERSPVWDEIWRRLLSPLPATPHSPAESQCTRAAQDKQPAREPAAAPRRVARPPTAIPRRPTRKGPWKVGTA
jgi:hypothetical protein